MSNPAGKASNKNTSIAMPLVAVGKNIGKEHMRRINYTFYK